MFLVQGMSSETKQEDKFSANLLAQKTEDVHHKVILLYKISPTTSTVYLFLAQQPPGGQVILIHEVSRSHTTTHHSQ